MNAKYFTRFFQLVMVMTLLWIPLNGKAEGHIRSEEHNLFAPASVDTWNTYTNANHVNAIAVEAGSFWAGTTGGLVRWDQTSGEYQKYIPATSGLAGLAITAAVIDSSGNKWLGTGYGVNKFDGSTWTTYTTGNGLVSNVVMDIAIDGNGSLWFAAIGGVSVFDGVNWTSYTKYNSGLASNVINAVAIDGNVKWFGTNGNGLSKFDGASWTTYTVEGGDSFQNKINDIAVAANGVIWIAAGNTMGGSGGGGGCLASFDGNTWTVYTEDNSGLASSYVFAVAVDGNGTVWAGTEWGVSKWDGISWTTYRSSDGLVDNWVNAVVVQGSTLWFGTNGGGISRFDAGVWTTYQTRDGLPDNELFVMAAVGDDLWFSGGSRYVITNYSGVTKFDGTTWTDYTYFETGLSSPEVYAVERDQDGLMWFGGWDINTFDGTDWEYYSDPYASGIVKEMAIDGNNKWFYAYEPFGSELWVSKFDGSTWTAYTTSNSGLVDPWVTAIAIDTDHSVWIGTGSGVSHFDGSTWTTYTTTHGLVSDDVSDIVVDGAGNKWFGTDNGVSKFDGAYWTTYTTANGLPDNDINGIAIEPGGILWFATDGGVSKFDGANWTTYNTSNSGLADNSVLDVAITQSGHRWFYTKGGVSEFFSTPDLDINYTEGTPRSYFNLTGTGFPPNQTAAVTVNGNAVGNIPVDANGSFIFTLLTTNADEGVYNVIASVNPSAFTRFRINASSQLRAQEGSFTTFDVPEGIAITSEVFLPLTTR